MTTKIELLREQPGLKHNLLKFIVTQKKEIYEKNSCLMSLHFYHQSAHRI